MIDIVRGPRGVQALQPVATDLHQTVRRHRQAHDQGMLQLGQPLPVFLTRHQGDIGGADAAVGQIDAGWGLGRPADAAQDHVGVLQLIQRALTVVVGDGEVQGADTVEIAVVQRVLRPDAGRDIGAQIARQRPHQRVQRADLRRLQPAAAFLQLFAQLTVDQGVQHHAGRPGDFFQHALHLLGRTDQGIDVFDGDDAVETGDHGLGHGVQGLAGRVRDQVDVEIGGETRRGSGGAHGSDRLLILKPPG